MGKDYYNILGVDKNASQEEIKKAFRQKAHQYHPDKTGGDEAKFKEINEAYQVLGDAKKRSQYDQYGSVFENAQAGGGFQGFEGFRDFTGYTNGFNVEDFGDIFGGFGDIFGFGGGRKKRQRKGQDVQMILTIEFLEAVFGAEKEINFKKSVLCDECKGSGAQQGSKIETCKACGGTGRTARVQRTILGNIQVQMTCESCGGEGKIYNKCRKCKGSGVVQEPVNLKVKIPAGIDEGETIRLSEQGDMGEKGSPAGDLYLKIRIAPDKRFAREGYNIKSKKEISFTLAALGGKIDVETVDGIVQLYIPEGTQSSTIFRLKGKGVPRLQERGRGDQLIEIIVKVPTHLNRKQKELLKELENNK